MENRHGLIENSEVFEGNGTAERDAARVLLEPIPGTKPVTVGADKAYDTADFVAECRSLKVTPHVAQSLGDPVGARLMLAGRSTLDMPSVRRKQKRVEECFRWLRRSRSSEKFSIVESSG